MYRSLTSFAPLLTICLALFGSNGFSDEAKPTRKKSTKAEEKNPVVPTPTMAEVPYGPHERNVLDFWKSESKIPTPLIFVIHGGGWVGGGKERIGKFVDVEPILKAGISLVAINYRYTTMAGDVTPPVKAPLHDAALALQFVRSKAVEWNIDKTRIGATGGSAGACSSLWLAFHDDMANPGSSDPVSRESTRLMCAAVLGAQTTLDPKQMKEWTPNSKYGAHAFGITAEGKTPAFQAFLDARERIAPWIAEYSPYALVTSDDPPVYLSYSAAPALGQDQKDPTHTANFGVKLQEKCAEAGVSCELAYPGATNVKHDSTTSFLISKLKIQ